MTKRHYFILFLHYAYNRKIKFHYQAGPGQGREVEEIKFGEFSASLFWTFCFLYGIKLSPVCLWITIYFQEKLWNESFSGSLNFGSYTSRPSEIFISFEILTLWLITNFRHADTHAHTRKQPQPNQTRPKRFLRTISSYYYPRIFLLLKIVK